MTRMRRANVALTTMWTARCNRYTANFDLEGKAMPETTYTIKSNRVEYQGKAAAAFIEKNHAQPFFLYVGLYGPHLPRIAKDDPYYLNFPAMKSPHRTPELDDIRRQGLALVKAVDDAVDRMMKKLREHGLEENTIIFFAGDNGAQPKYFSNADGPRDAREVGRLRERAAAR